MVNSGTSSHHGAIAIYGQDQVILYRIRSRNHFGIPMNLVNSGTSSHYGAIAIYGQDQVILYRIRSRNHFGIPMNLPLVGLHGALPLWLLPYLCDCITMATGIYYIFVCIDDHICIL